MGGLKADPNAPTNKGNSFMRLADAAKKISGYKEPVKTETPLNPVMVEPTKKKVFSTTSGSSGRSLLGG